MICAIKRKLLHNKNTHYNRNGKFFDWDWDCKTAVPSQKIFCGRVRYNQDDICTKGRGCLGKKMCKNSHTLLTIYTHLRDFGTINLNIFISKIKKVQARCDALSIIIIHTDFSFITSSSWSWTSYIAKICLHDFLFS